MSDTPIDDLETSIDIEVNPFDELQAAISALPAVDPERVEKVLAKLRAGKLDILGDEKQRLAAATRIARQLIQGDPEPQ